MTVAVSTFGALNGLALANPPVSYAMAAENSRCDIEGGSRASASVLRA